jgi:hypothetical protein
LVVKEQVDELGDLDIVDGNNRFAATGIGNDQVPLLCMLIHLYTPHRCAIDSASGEYRVAKVGLN